MDQKTVAKLARMGYIRIHREKKKPFVTKEGRLVLTPEGAEKRFQLASKHQNSKEKNVSLSLGDEILLEGLRECKFDKKCEKMLKRKNQKRKKKGKPTKPNPKRRRFRP